MHHARHKTDNMVYERIDHKSALQMRKENDVLSDKPLKKHMEKKVISKMMGKAAGPSGIKLEMIRIADDTGNTMIQDLANAIIHDGKVKTD